MNLFISDYYYYYDINTSKKDFELNRSIERYPWPHNKNKKKIHKTSDKSYINRNCFYATFTQICKIIYGIDSLDKNINT